MQRKTVKPLFVQEVKKLKIHLLYLYEHMSHALMTNLNPETKFHPENELDGECTSYLITH